MLHNETIDAVEYLKSVEVECWACEGKPRSYPMGVGHAICPECRGKGMISLFHPLVCDCECHDCDECDGCHECEAAHDNPEMAGFALMRIVREFGWTVELSEGGDWVVFDPRNLETCGRSSKGDDSQNFLIALAEAFAKFQKTTTANIVSITR